MYVKKDIQLNVIKTQATTNGVIYDKYKNELGDSVLKELREVKESTRSNSTFILKCMRAQFKNIDELKSTSACGKKNFSILSENKRKMLEKLFFER